MKSALQTESTERVTQKDVAERAGLSQMTVSRALRDDPKVRKSTRERVRKLAAELGFVPDPLLTALVTYKRSTNLRVEQTRIALIETRPHANMHPSDSVLNRQLLDGVFRSCKLYGFEPHVVRFDAEKTNPKTLRTRLLKKGISSVIWLCPEGGLSLPQPPFDISEFYTVSVGWSFSDVPINSVTNDWQRAVHLAIRESVACGHKRIGMLISEKQNRRQWRGISEAFLVCRGLNPGVEFIEPFDIDLVAQSKDGAALLADWIRRQRPDAILGGIGGRHLLEDVAAAVGIRFPDHYGFACIDVADAINPDDSGAAWNRERTGEIAINQIFNSIRNGQRGIPKTYQRIMVEPKWRDGNSLRKST